VVPATRTPNILLSLHNLALWMMQRHTHPVGSLAGSRRPATGWNQPHRADCNDDIVTGQIIVTDTKDLVDRSLNQDQPVNKCVADGFTLGT